MICSEITNGRACLRRKFHVRRTVGVPHGCGCARGEWHIVGACGRGGAGGRLLQIFGDFLPIFGDFFYQIFGAMPKFGAAAAVNMRPDLANLCAEINALAPN